LNTELSAAYLEADTLNQELQYRQEILENQATEIEIINTQLQEQNEILMRLDIEKNELLGIVSHDLKNPISAVLGLAEMLQSEVNAGTENTSAITEQIVLAANQMLLLVKNLLDVNRLEEGAMTFTMEQCNLLHLVDTTVRQYLPIAAAKQITIHYFPEVASSLVFADKQSVMQILDNLLSNAVKYSPLGKNVFVRVCHSPLVIGQSSDENSPHSTDHVTNVLMTNDHVTNTQSTNDYVRVEVQDEGEGIAEEEQTKLFGKFVRLSARPTGGEHSTGLGLSIVKKMVEAMNGRVWCESESGNGATFIVELPRA
jgi:signal transduction histidine kinase